VSVRLLSDLLEGKMYNEEETRRILGSFPQSPVAAQIAYKFVRNNWQIIVARYFVISLSSRNDYAAIINAFSVSRFSKSRPILKAFALATMNGLISNEDLEDVSTLVYYSFTRSGDRDSKWNNPLE